MLTHADVIGVRIRRRAVGEIRDLSHEPAIVGAIRGHRSYCGDGSAESLHHGRLRLARLSGHARQNLRCEKTLYVLEHGSHVVPPLGRDRPTSKTANDIPE